ncbi:hypothetical protein FisN_18Hh177 [Fistulifera solaris]|jgi:hypothetical protein|uniref:Uncharacterized protein n=1 Tax=Fistulifera solaris TaxID=1519565 RepID=A0A1Z5JVR4_FISSO|nr:hypothetical protein FisN_18Hh177 [Fistulifera solaris]|eukprot:GAX17966.1 hypothetical protein FisN_18Hh177 [Fistulifera solaris]
MSGGGDSTAHKSCSLTETIIFLLAIVSGTACSICSKTMMEQHAIGMDGDYEKFEKPLFQTLGMFIGMIAGLFMHAIVMYWKIPFPGYVFPSSAPPNGAAPTEKDRLLKQLPTLEAPETQVVPVWMYFFLIIPAIFDLGATALCMMGLRYLDVSIYQMLRGSGIIFVALMKQHVLKDRLYNFQWLGVFWNVVSVLLVGGTALLNSSDESTSNVDPGKAMLGLGLVLTGAFVQALQFVFEEKVMTMDVPSPPLLLIGMEGLWGTLLSLCVLYPVAYYLPGDDHGSYENPFNTWYMLVNSTDLQIWFFVYFFAIFGYNLFAVLVTFLLNSVWHAILDNFRPITVWGTDMFIFYFISAQFGETWTPYSWIQLVGMAVLLYGTAIYNAPNSGSLRLEGGPEGCCLNFRDEYEDIERRLEDERLHAEWLNRKMSFAEKRLTGSFAGEWLGSTRL